MTIKIPNSNWSLGIGELGNWGTEKLGKTLTINKLC